MEENKLSKRQLLKRSHVIKYGDVGGILLVEFGIIGLSFSLNLPTELTHLDSGNLLFFIGLCTLALIGWGLLGYYRDLYDIVHKHTKTGYGIVKKIYKENDKKGYSPYKVDLEIEDLELDGVLKILGITKKAQKKYGALRQEGTKTLYVYDKDLIGKLQVGGRIQYTSLCTKDLIVDVQPLNGVKPTIVAEGQYPSMEDFEVKRTKEEADLESKKNSTKRKIESGLFVLGLLVINGILLELLRLSF